MNVHFRNCGKKPCQHAIIVFSLMLILSAEPVWAATPLPEDRRLESLLISSQDTLPEVEYANPDDPSLTRILDIAAYKNPTIAAAIERVNQARADVKGAAADLGPSVTGGLGARWNKDAGQSYALDPATGAVTGVIPAGYRNSYNATLSFLQTLYSGGSLAANKKAAEFALEGTRAEGLRAYQNVQNSVRTYYYDTLRALAQLQVRTEAYELSLEHLKQTQALFRGGIVPMGDVLRVQVSTSQSELNRLRAANNLDVAWLTLERAVNDPLPRTEVLKPVSGDSVSRLKPPLGTIPGDPTGRALTQRAEIKTYEYYKLRADQLVKAAEGQYLPRVQISGQTGNNDDSFFPSDNDTWYVEMGLQWTLFDSGKTASQVLRAKASARELLYQIDDLIAQIRLEVMTAELNLRSALIRLLIAQEQVKRAEEDYRRTMKRYEAQMSTNLDVLDSRLSLTDSRTEYVNAVYDIAIAQANLIYAMGDDIPPRDLFQGDGASARVMEDMKK